MRLAVFRCRHNAYNPGAEKVALIPVTVVFKATAGYKVIFIGTYIGNGVINGYIVLKIRNSYTVCFPKRRFRILLGRRLCNRLFSLFNGNIGHIIFR